MSFLAKREFLFILLISMTFLSKAVFSQNDEAADQFQRVEDSTLDDSGKEAVDAANSAEPEHQEEAIKPHEVVPSKQEQTIQENNAQEQAGQTEEAKELKSVEEPKKEAEVFTLDGSGDMSKYETRKFGKYRVQLAVNMPSMGADQKCFDKLYGKPRSGLGFMVDWFPKNLPVNPGLTFKVSPFSASGNAASGKFTKGSTVDCNSLVIDDNGPTSLTMIPIQLGAKLEGSPFGRKWIVFDVWVAGEFEWWQETRDASSSSSTSPKTSSSSGANDKSTSSDTSTQVYTNSGNKMAMSTGISANFLMNSLDDKGVRTMRGSLGIGSVYLTTFYEMIKSTSKSGVSFSRNVIGVGFTFETLN